MQKEMNVGKIRYPKEWEIIPEYGQKKLLMYADSFRNLARIFSYMKVDEKVNIEAKLDERADLLLQKRMEENREVLAEHLQEVACIMTNVAKESYGTNKVRGREHRETESFFRKHAILMEKVCSLRNIEGHIEILLSICVSDNNTLKVKEIADVLSVIFDMRLLPAKQMGEELVKGRNFLVFEEEGNYTALGGVARATKEGEKISGDNYSFYHIGATHLLAALSDGVGTGEKANADSEIVLDLLEKFMEAGFTKETAVPIINGVLVAGSEKQNMSTLDLCEIDLYEGRCGFVKMGSTVSFIKHANSVERIFSTTLPLGVFGQIEVEVADRLLDSGEYIILVTDGVIDAVTSDESLNKFSKFITDLTVESPQEMANKILNFAICEAGGSIRDDMSVLVIGIWEN